MKKENEKIVKRKVKVARVHTQKSLGLFAQRSAVRQELFWLGFSFWCYSGFLGGDEIYKFRILLVTFIFEISQISNVFVQNFGENIAKIS